MEAKIHGNGPQHPRKKDGRWRSFVNTVSRRYQSKKCCDRARAIKTYTKKLFAIQNVNAMSTVITALATVAIFVSALLQWSAMQSQLNEMKQQGIVTKIQLRANLRQGSATITPSNLGWEISPTWTNVGGTDAKDFFGWFNISVY